MDTSFLADVKRHFYDGANSQRAWELSAGNLWIAADTLKHGTNAPANASYDELRELFPELMLRGYSIECLLKALWLKNGNQLFSGTTHVGITGAGPASHDLVKMAVANSVKLSDKQTSVLKRLTLCTMWAGRYPCPTKWVQTTGDNIAYWKRGEDDDVCDSIVVEIDKMLKTITQSVV